VGDGVFQCSICKDKGVEAKCNKNGRKHHFEAFHQASTEPTFTYRDKTKTLIQRRDDGKFECPFCGVVLGTPATIGLHANNECGAPEECVLINSTVMSCVT
jgi:hypothetical protein